MDLKWLVEWLVMDYVFIRVCACVLFSVLCMVGSTVNSFARLIQEGKRLLERERRMRWKRGKQQLASPGEE